LVTNLSKHQKVLEILNPAFHFATFLGTIPLLRDKTELGIIFYRTKWFDSHSHLNLYLIKFLYLAILSLILISSALFFYTCDFSFPYVVATYVGLALNVLYHGLIRMFHDDGCEMTVFLNGIFKLFYSQSNLILRILYCTENSKKS